VSSSAGALLGRSGDGMCTLNFRASHFAKDQRGGAGFVSRSSARAPMPLRQYSRCTRVDSGPRGTSVEIPAARCANACFSSNLDRGEARVFTRASRGRKRTGRRCRGSVLRAARLRDRRPPRPCSRTNARESALPRSTKRARDYHSHVACIPCIALARCEPSHDARGPLPVQSSPMPAQSLTWRTRAKSLVPIAGRSSQRTRAADPQWMPPAWMPASPPARGSLPRPPRTEHSVTPDGSVARSSAPH